VRLLLDTHVFIWANAWPQRLSPHVRNLLQNIRHTLFLSAASVWEISLKHALKKKDFQFDEEAVLAGVKNLKCEVLPIDFRHVLSLYRLPELHRDPFDRMLISQALTDDLALITADERLEDYKLVQTIW
jgi:PIN domain nuclease of toxin-antitoxin system